MLPVLPAGWLIAGAGAAQIVLALGSLLIPRVLHWPEETRKLNSLTRQIFWTYAGYIFMSHVCFGLLSLFHPESLIDGSPLATAVTAFIAMWWIARLTLQFTVLDRSAAPAGINYRVAEVLLVLLFVFFAITYGAATLSNLLRTAG